MITPLHRAVQELWDLLSKSMGKFKFFESRDSSLSLKFSKGCIDVDGSLGVPSWQLTVLSTFTGAVMNILLPTDHQKDLYFISYICYQFLHNSAFISHASSKLRCSKCQKIIEEGVLYPWTLFLKTLWIFSINKATLDKVPNGSN